MASINLSGILKDSLDEVDVGAIIKFTHLTTTGEVINTTEQALIVPPDGSYNIDVNYGLVRIDYTTKNTERYVATVTVNDETVATTLPELIGTVTPVTEESLLFMQGLVADASESADRAEAEADRVAELVNVGESNTSVGDGALDSITTGVGNSALGVVALGGNTTGDFNSAIGDTALENNTTGNRNTALGRGALELNETGNVNLALGDGALSSNTTGSGNTAISPRNSSGSYAPVFDPTTENDRVCIGSTSVTNAYIQVPWTVVSDARDKTAFTDIDLGLDFVNSLNPVSYKFRESRDSEKTVGTTKYGFKAQEVLDLEGDSPVIVDNEDPEKLRMIDTALIPVLVKAIQELSKTVKSQQEKINSLTL